MYDCPIPMKNTFISSRWFARSRKLGRNVQFNGSLTYDAWVLLETAPTVISYCERPVQLRFNINGRLDNSVIDFWVLKSDSTQIYITISDSFKIDIHHPKVSRKSIERIHAIEQWCCSNGSIFTTWTEADIRSNPIYLNNMKLLLPYLHQHNVPIETDRHRLLRFLGNSPKSLSSIQTELNDMSSSRVLECIAHLYVEGLIIGEFEITPVGPEFRVWVLFTCEM